MGETGRRIVVADRVVQPGGALEGQVGVVAGDDELGGLAGGGEQLGSRAPAAQFGSDFHPGGGPGRR